MVASVYCMCENQDMTTNFLPNELLHLVLSKCNAKDILSVASTCSILRNLPISKSIYSTFTLSSTTTWNDLKVLISHANDVETLKVNGYSFIQELFLDLPKLKHLELVSCSLSSLDFIFKTMKSVQTIILLDCKVDNKPDISTLSQITNLSKLEINHLTVLSR